MLRYVLKFLCYVTFFTKADLSAGGPGQIKIVKLSPWSYPDDAAAGAAAAASAPASAAAVVFII